MSPIKILAGGALYHRKPKQDPTIEPQKIASSPVSGIYCNFRYSENIVFPTTYDINVKTSGGGLTGQTDAIILGIARALTKLDEDNRTVLKTAGLLTRDARIKERKKYGLKKARKASQFSKR